MPDTIRYPDSTNAQEAPEVIAIFIGTTIRKGGVSFESIAPLRQASGQPLSSPFVDAVITFSANQAVTIGDGATDIVGLYGQIGNDDSTRVLLGTMGLTLTTGLMPQIPIIVDTNGHIIGFAQIVQAVTLYDWLAIGGLNGDIALGGATVTATIRPMIMRSFPG